LFLDIALKPTKSDQKRQNLTRQSYQEENLICDSGATDGAFCKLTGGNSVTIQYPALDDGQSIEITSPSGISQITAITCGHCVGEELDP
jgi:hypothetical protein